MNSDIHSGSIIVHSNIPICRVQMQIYRKFLTGCIGQRFGLNLRNQGVSDDVAWLLEKLYSNQHGQVLGQLDGVDFCRINAGICRSTPRLRSESTFFLRCTSRGHTAMGAKSGTTWESI